MTGSFHSIGPSLHRSIGPSRQRITPPAPIGGSVNGLWLRRRVGDLRLGCGLGWVRLQHQRREYRTYSRGGGEYVESDLEAVRQRSAAERADPRVRVDITGGEAGRDRGG